MRREDSLESRSESLIHRSAAKATQTLGKDSDPNVIVWRAELSARSQQLTVCPLLALAHFHRRKIRPSALPGDNQRATKQKAGLDLGLSGKRLQVIRTEQG